MKNSVPVPAATALGVITMAVFAPITSHAVVGPVDLMARGADAPMSPML
jgi:hypothetical protein